ncbi:YciI family protein [Bosea lathyri]|uniref:Uncharacterized conserved protein n=1 Tax=Bosea lathyri TaxID=1036778 RepID=A0A1H6B3F8_9HYPH|nr:YciI family protein [Bosea lathyri]SEG54915.1 Uncharacterized conserved protein [Bosea lathyri]
MRYMIIVRATKDSEAGIFPEDDALMASMATYHEELAKAGVLLEGSGLKPSSKGWRIRHAADGRSTVVDGPFAETKELIAGYTVIKVNSREEALDWSRRFPRPFELGQDCEIEIRELYELEDFETMGSVQRFRDIGMGSV